MGSTLKRWLALPDDDRAAIIKLIADHEAVVVGRQREYKKVHENRDEVLVNAFRRRRIATVLAREMLSEPDSDQQERESSKGG